MRTKKQWKKMEVRLRRELDHEIREDNVKAEKMLQNWLGDDLEKIRVLDHEKKLLFKKLSARCGGIYSGAVRAINEQDSLECLTDKKFCEEQRAGLLKIISRRNKHSREFLKIQDKTSYPYRGKYSQYPSHAVELWRTRIEKGILKEKLITSRGGEVRDFKKFASDEIVEKCEKRGVTATHCLLPDNGEFWNRYTGDSVLKTDKGNYSWHYNAAEMTFAEAYKNLMAKRAEMLKLARESRAPAAERAKKIADKKIPQGLFEKLKFCSAGVKNALELIPNLYELTVSQIKKHEKFSELKKSYKTECIAVENALIKL